MAGRARVAQSAQRRAVRNHEAQSSWSPVAGPRLRRAKSALCLCRVGTDAWTLRPLHLVPTPDHGRSECRRSARTLRSGPEAKALAAARRPEWHAPASPAVAARRLDSCDSQPARTRVSYRQRAGAARLFFSDPWCCRRAAVNVRLCLLRESIASVGGGLRTWSCRAAWWLVTSKTFRNKSFELTADGAHCALSE